MTTKAILFKGARPTKEQIEEVRKAVSMPVVFDEDCPQLTEEQLKQFGPPKNRWKPAEELTGEILAEADIIYWPDGTVTHKNAQG
ncbi:MAG: hypothetical protein K5981_07350 [Clostridia bacterium]|nr:hypothetical protein [Clostridia bacterium]